MIRRYATPLAFKQALEQRIKSSSTTGADFARRRQLLVFDRFLARVVSVVGDAATLKGGLVLEMRLARGSARYDRRDQRGGAPLSLREDVPISRDSLPAGFDPRAASLLGRPLCCNGCVRRADLEDSRGSYRSGFVLPESRSRELSAGQDLSTRGLVLAGAL